MIEKDKLIKKLEGFDPPVWSNPQHQEILKAQLNRLILEDEVPSKILHPRWRPIVIMACAAMFLILGGVFILQTWTARHDLTLPGISAPVVMTSGTSSIFRNEHFSILQAGDRVDTDVRIAVSENSVLSFMLPGGVSVKVIGPANFTIMRELGTDSIKKPGIVLEDGILQMKQESGQKSPYAVAVGDITYQPSATVFQVAANDLGASNVLVLQGVVNIYQYGQINNQLMAKVTTGKSYTITAGGVGSLNEVVNEDWKALLAFDSEEMIVPKDPSTWIPVTVHAQPPESAIAVNGRVIGHGSVSFMSVSGFNLEISVSAIGYVAAKKNLIVGQADHPVVDLQLNKEEGAIAPAIPVEPTPEASAEESGVAMINSDPVIPEQAITFTGKRTDWTGAFTTFDKDSQVVSEQGCDLDQVYLSKSGRFLFVGVAFKKNIPNNNLLPEMTVSLAAGNGDRIDLLAYLYGSIWKMSGNAVLSGKSIKITGDNLVTAGDDILEMRLDLDTLGTWSDQQGPVDFTMNLKIQKFMNLKTKPDEIDLFRLNWK